MRKAAKILMVANIFMIGFWLAEIAANLFTGNFFSISTIINALLVALCCVNCVNLILANLKNEEMKRLFEAVKEPACMLA